MATIGKIALLLFALHAHCAEVPPTATVVVTPNPVGESESVQLRIEVEASQAAVVFQPTFDAPDFIRVGSQPQYGGSQGKKFLSGSDVPVQKVFFEYVLSPKKAGALYIRNIRVKIGKQEISSPDTMVKVTPEATGSHRPTRALPQTPDNDDDDAGNPAAPGNSAGGSGSGSYSTPQSLPESFNSDFTVFASPSKQKAYVGEPIVMEYWLYDYGDLRQIEVQKWPNFTGFWKDDLEITSRFEFDEMYVGNELMRRAFLGRFALYGIKTGRITVDKLVIRGQYLSNTAIQGFFQVPQMRVGTHASQDMNIEILPLPSEGKPEKFSGAVGNFLVKVEADKTTLLQNTPVTFLVTIEGTGNFQSIDSFRLPLPADFELYESATSARGSTPLGMKRDLHTQKTFQITAVPRKAGKFHIAPVEWWFFDPQKASYQRATTSPIDIQVEESAVGAKDTNTYGSPNGGSPNPGTVEPRPLKADLVPASTLWLNYALGFLVLVNALFASLWIKRSSSGYVEQIFRDPLAEAKAELSEAKGAKGNSWPTHLENALYSISETLMGSNPRGLTRQDQENQWREQGLPAPLFHQISLVLDKLDQIRFGAAKAADHNLRANLQKEVEGILKEAAPVKRRPVG